MVVDVVVTSLTAPTVPVYQLQSVKGMVVGKDAKSSLALRAPKQPLATVFLMVAESGVVFLVAKPQHEGKLGNALHMVEANDVCTTALILAQTARVGEV